MFRSLVVFTATALTLCAADNPPGVRVVEEIAAKVNGDIITRGELERKRLEIEAEARKQGLSGDRLKQAVDEYFRQNMKNQLLTQLVMGQEVMRNITVSEAELQKYYDEHKGDYMRKEAQVFLSQIVIST